jgi:hypothetical protein
METNEQEAASRGLVPGRHVRLSGEYAKVCIPGQPGQPAKAEPRVEVIRDGDVIQAIEVTCGCGQRVRIRCLYPTTA